MTRIYTIGHSNMPVDRFLELLRGQGIQTVIDVRSAPYSAWAGQFGKHEIESALTAAGFRYAYAGDRLGGKPQDESLYTLGGAPDYDRIAKTQSFRDGLDWLIREAENTHVAIMCSEADAFSCHRERLIGKKLREKGVEVLHITIDGQIAVQEQGSLF